MIWIVFFIGLRLDIPMMPEVDFFHKCFWLLAMSLRKMNDTFPVNKLSADFPKLKTPMACPSLACLRCTAAGKLGSGYRLQVRPAEMPTRFGLSAAIPHARYLVNPVRERVRGFLFVFGIQDVRLVSHATVT